MELNSVELDANELPTRKEWDLSFQVMRQSLLQKYDGLITRVFLREERWLERTLVALEDLLIIEKSIRDDIVVKEQREFCSLDVSLVRLHTIAAEGTQGTTIEIEECEREVRYRSLFFDQVVAWEALTTRELKGRSDATRREQERTQQLEDDLQAIVDGETIERLQFLLDEIPVRFDVEDQEERARGTAYGQLLWRVNVSEVDSRYEIEHEEDAMFCENFSEPPPWAGKKVEVPVCEDAPPEEVVTPEPPKLSEEEEKLVALLLVAVPAGRESIEIEARRRAEVPT